nr:Rv3654c family TadE-like protein [Streptomyces albidochromogenes]
MVSTPANTTPSTTTTATVWAVAVVVVLGVVFAGVLTMGQAVVARHRAGGAADLAALAAAGEWMRGEAAACGEAAEVAAAQDTRLVRCSVRGEVSDVTAEAFTGPYSVAVRARAGPAGPVGAGASPRGSQRPQAASGHREGGPVRQERPGPAGLP